VSGTGLALDYQARTGTHVTAAEVVTRAARGDAPARGALDRYADRLARGLATVVNVLDPDVIVLGGGMSNVASLYVDVPSRLPAWVFSDRVTTRVVPPKHGDSSGVRGAAWLWPAT
jgi:fructokinase